MQASVMSSGEAYSLTHSERLSRKKQGVGIHSLEVGWGTDKIQLLNCVNKSLI